MKPYVMLNLIQHPAIRNGFRIKFGMTYKRKANFTHLESGQNDLD